MFMRKLIFLAVMILQTASALACTTITSCGVLAVTDSYCASGTVFNLASPGDCITIAAPNTSLTLDSITVNGPVYPPGGTGIHILASAPNAVVNITGASNIGGAITTQGLNIGIEDDGSNATISVEGYVAGSVNGTTGYGIYLQNVTGTSVAIKASSNGTTSVVGDLHGLWILGGSHNVVVSNFDSLGTSEPAGTINGSNSAALLIQNSNHNVVNHIFAGGQGDAILLDNSPGNMIFNNVVQGDPYGIRVRWNSPNNIIEHNLIATSVVAPSDLFQGTHPETIGCNGNYWANNTHTNDNLGNPLSVTFNQPCVGTMQAASNY